MRVSTITPERQQDLRYVVVVRSTVTVDIATLTFVTNAVAVGVGVIGWIEDPGAAIDIVTQAVVVCIAWDAEC